MNNGKYDKTRFVANEVYPPRHHPSDVRFYLALVMWGWDGLFSLA